MPGMSVQQLISLVAGALPVADRKKSKSLITGLVNAGIIAVSNRYPFWWRKVYSDRSITAETTLEDMPENCQIIAADSIRVVDADGNPEAFIKYITPEEFDELYIADDEQYTSDDYPIYFTVPPREQASNLQGIKFLGVAKSSFTARVYFYQYASLEDLQRITDPMVIVDYALARVPSLEDTQKYLTFFADGFQQMIDVDKAAAGQPKLSFAPDRDVESAERHIRVIQER